MMNKMSSGNPIVDEMANISITGNVVPVEWFKTITYPSGKPYLTAIFILSDIVYWYRPSVIRDERTGSITGVKKRFKADLLQRSYENISEQLGVSKREAKLAIVALENLGVIKRVFRTIKTSTVVVSNVMFLELVPSKLKALSLLTCDTAMTSVCQRVCHTDVTGGASECQTYTENTTETTTENTKNNLDNTNVLSCREANASSTTLGEGRDEKEKEVKVTAERVISYLNRKTGSKYKSTTGKTLGYIRQRLKDGYKPEDFKTVIDNKCAEWMGTAQQKYLRPQTLFIPNNFENYLNQGTNTPRTNGKETKEKFTCMVNQLYTELEE